jgi:hypothetical protein
MTQDLQQLFYSNGDLYDDPNARPFMKAVRNPFGMQDALLTVNRVDPHTDRLEWISEQDIDFGKHKELYRKRTKIMVLAKEGVLVSCGTRKKTVLGASFVLALEQEQITRDLFREAAKSLGLHNPGAGIAFTLPLSAINMPVLDVFMHTEKNEANMTDNEVKGESKITIKGDLIMAVLNQGYSDEFMSKAREAGAGGGTVLGGRSSLHKGPMKFLGLNVQDEKEIVIILATREKREKIMETVSRSHGVSTKAEGIIFSLPVDEVSGVELR